MTEISIFFTSFCGTAFGFATCMFVALIFERWR